MAPKCRTRHYLTLINYKSVWCQNLPSLMMTGGGAVPICRSGQWNSRNHSRNKCATRALVTYVEFGGRKGGMSKCLQEKHKIIRFSKTFFFNGKSKDIELKCSFSRSKKHIFCIWKTLISKLLAYNTHINSVQMIKKCLFTISLLYHDVRRPCKATCHFSYDNEMRWKSK